MQAFDMKTCGVAVDLISKVIGRIRAEHELPVHGDGWDQTCCSVRAATTLLMTGHPLESEKDEEIRAKILHRAIMHVLTLFSWIDGERYKAGPGASILYTASEKIRLCIPDYEIEEYKAELLEQATICRETIEQIKDKFKFTTNDHNETEHARKTTNPRNLLAFVNGHDIDAYQERLVRNKLRNVERELQLIQTRLDTAGDGFNEQAISRFIRSVVHTTLPSKPQDIKSQLDLAFALTIAFIASQKTISFIGDLADMIKSGFQVDLPIPHLDIPERNELARITEAIEVKRRDIADVKEQLQDSSLDHQEKQHLISTRNRLEQTFADDSHRKLELADRLQWKEPQEQGQRNAIALMDAITRIHDALIQGLARLSP